MFRTWTFQGLVFYKSNYVSLILSNASFSLCLSGRFVQTAWTFHDLLSISRSYLFLQISFFRTETFRLMPFHAFQAYPFQESPCLPLWQAYFLSFWSHKTLETNTHTVFCDCSTFARALIFFLLALSSVTLPSTVAAPAHKPEVWLPNFLR